MKSFLLDVNVLIALNVETHPHHERAKAWISGKEVSLCPLSELGFLRIATNKRALNLPMDDARKALADFARHYKAGWIAADLRALDSTAKTSEQVTDAYLFELARSYGMKLATFDAGIASAEVIA